MLTGLHQPDLGRADESRSGGLRPVAMVIGLVAACWRARMFRSLPLVIVSGIVVTIFVPRATPIAPTSSPESPARRRLRRYLTAAVGRSCCSRWRRSSDEFLGQICVLRRRLLRETASGARQVALPGRFGRRLRRRGVHFRAFGSFVLWGPCSSCCRRHGGPFRSRALRLAKVAKQERGPLSWRRWASVSG